MRILFLKKCKAPLIIYYAYFFTKLRNFFLKKKLSMKKENILIF